LKTHYLVYWHLMKIDGRAIANGILDELCAQVNVLKQQKVIPTLAVIQVGEDPGSNAYINQKKKAAERIGAVVIHEKLAADVSYQRVNILVHEYNTNPDIHGIIIQQPLPSSLSETSTLLNLVNHKKDVDGFLPNSPYPVPVAAAVMMILKEVFNLSSRPLSRDPSDRNTGFRVKPGMTSFNEWSKFRSFVVLGRGETAGKPIAEALKKQGCNITVIHSQTPNPDEITKTADIVISCVGKENIVRRDNIKTGSILLSVGLSRDNEGKLHGDYEEDEIKDVAAFYTPTPGGVGPVNVANLMANLIKAASKLL